MLSFGTVVAVNNLLAMRAFNTFLSNYILFNKPSFIEKYLIKRSKIWIYSKALKEYKELKEEVKKDTINVSLNDCPAGLFAVLFLANDPKAVFKDATELFASISASELEFVKLQKPKSNEAYK